MSEIRPKRLTKLDCIIQAEECRHFASCHVEHMADTWERIATDIETQAKRPFPRLV
jgi:hypothetical protein